MKKILILLLCGLVINLQSAVQVRLFEKITQYESRRILVGLCQSFPPVPDFMKKIDSSPQVKRSIWIMAFEQSLNPKKVLRKQIFPGHTIDCSAFKGKNGIEQQWGMNIWKIADNANLKTALLSNHYSAIVSWLNDVHRHRSVLLEACQSNAPAESHQQLMATYGKFLNGTQDNGLVPSASVANSAADSSVMSNAEMQNLAWDFSVLKKHLDLANTIFSPKSAERDVQKKIR